MIYNLTLFKPKKTDILLLDNNYANLKFPKLKTEIFKYKKIYLIIFLHSLLNFLFKNKEKKKIKEIYLRIFFEALKPKVIIGHNFNHLIFAVKKYSPNSKVIIYTHSWLYSSELNDLKKISKSAKIDYFFVCDEFYKKILRKNFKSNFIVNGLVKNNEIKIIKIKKKYDLAYISEYRISNYPKKNIHLKFIKQVAKILNEYATVHNKKVVLALNSSRKDKNIPQEEEIKFFKEIFPNIIFLPGKNSYEVCNLAEVTVCLNSNLGADLLARGKKVLFLTFLNKFGSAFENPYFKKKSFFTYNKKNKKVIFNKINYLLNKKEKFWKKKLKQSKIKIIFDKDNFLLKKQIYKIIENYKIFD